MRMMAIPSSINSKDHFLTTLTALLTYARRPRRRRPIKVAEIFRDEVREPDAARVSVGLNGLPLLPAYGGAARARTRNCRSIRRGAFDAGA